MKELEELLAKFARPLPRYTSYPTAPTWHPLEERSYIERLEKLKGPISLYLHIPFCERICLFCGCSVVLNRKKENEIRYVEALIKEMDLLATYLSERTEVAQLHFGGGTPTKLDSELFQRLFEAIKGRFDISAAKEVAIEIDPRTIEEQPEKLTALRLLGFNRVSFGVQDVDPKVQEAVLRRQSLEMTQETFARARALGFDEVNLDLIYGLPYQTLESFEKTIEEIVNLGPDRIALFSYAKIPHLKGHQRAIKESSLPSERVKLQIYSRARSHLVRSGYIAIGMDHFARKDSELAKSYFAKRLYRNFQGYTVKHADALVGLGMSSISLLEEGYFQNFKELKSYYGAIENDRLPLERGKILSDEDRMRRYVIQALMCRFELDKRHFEENFGYPFDGHFQEERRALEECKEAALVEENSQKLIVTAMGELFVRNIAACFDSYLASKPDRPLFSSSI